MRHKYERLQCEHFCKPLQLMRGTDVEVEIHLINEKSPSYTLEPINQSTNQAINHVYLQQQGSSKRFISSKHKNKKSKKTSYSHQLRKPPTNVTFCRASSSKLINAHQICWSMLQLLWSITNSTPAGL